MINSVVLSERETEILKLVATGVSNKEIAHRLNISTNTVKVHLRNIFGKIGVLSRTEATLYAIEHRIVNSPGKPEAPEADNQSFLTRYRLVVIAVILLIVIGSLIGLFGRQYLPSSTRSGSVTPASPPQWQELTPLPEGRAGMAAVAYDNQIFLFSGETEEGITSKSLRYDFQDKEWSPIASKPSAVTDVQAVIVGEKVFIPGGWTGKEIIDKLEVYDPRTDSWEQKSHLPSKRSGYALVALEGMIYLFGGWDGTTVQDTIYTYNPQADTWTEMAPMTTPNAYMSAVTSGNKIYIMGGWNGSTSQKKSSVFIPTRSDTSDDPWTDIASLPIPFCFNAATELSNFIFISGELRNNCKHPNPSILQEDKIQYFTYKYDIASDQWQLIETHENISFFGYTLIGINNMIYYIGGYKDGLLSEDALYYQVMYSSTLPLIINP